MVNVNTRMSSSNSITDALLPVLSREESKPLSLSSALHLALKKAENDSPTFVVHFVASLFWVEGNSAGLVRLVFRMSKVGVFPPSLYSNEYCL